MLTFSTYLLLAKKKKSIQKKKKSVNTFKVKTFAKQISKKKKVILGETCKDLVIFSQDCLYKETVLGGSSAISYSFDFKLD